MPYKILFLPEAINNFNNLKSNPALQKRFKAVCKSLAYLENNPRHPGLNTHKFSSMSGPDGEEIFEAYAENKTPAAYRTFWFYDPDKQEITIIAITPHP